MTQGCIGDLRTRLKAISNFPYRVRKAPLCLLSLEVADHDAHWRTRRPDGQTHQVKIFIPGECHTGSGPRSIYGWTSVRPTRLLHPTRGLFPTHLLDGPCEIRRGAVRKPEHRLSAL